MVLFFILCAVICSFFTGVALGCALYERDHGTADKGDVLLVVALLIVTLVFLLCAQLAR